MYVNPKSTQNKKKRFIKGHINPQHASLLLNKDEH